MTAKERLKMLSKEDKRSRQLLMLISSLIGLTTIAQAYFIVSVADQIFLGGAALREAVPALSGVLVSLLVRAVLQYVNNLTGERLALKMKKRFRRELVRSFKHHPMDGDNTRTGGKISLLLDAVDEMDAYFSHYYVVMMQSSLVPLFLLGAIFYANWISGLILLVTAPFVPIVMAVIGRSTQRRSEEQMEKLNRFSSTFLDIVQGLTTLKLFGRSKQQQAAVERDSLRYRDATMDVLKIAFLSALMMEFISMLSISLVALEVGLRLVLFDQLTFATAFFVLILAPEFYASLKEMGGAFHAGRGSMAAAERVFEEIDKEEPESWGTRPLPERFTMSFKNWHYTYEDGRFQLGPVDLHCPEGSDTALIGPSGSGKSTLLHAAAGLLKTDGIYVNEEPLRTYREEDWYRALAYVTQHPYIFAGTLRENILLGLKEAGEADVEEAVEKAGLKETAESLPDGLDTVVGEGGRGLSGGEKQRVALARAFLKKPAVILYDEPTTGLDIRTERILKESMEELGRRAVVITSAHRLHTVRSADQIVLLRGGSVESTGTHESLRDTDPVYQEMLHVQQGGRA
ncbi:thiol reductant ABC exporter subunit CydD [Alkalicoccus urumqiensis]|uniref:Thiol reductant ABC exporter subunit CydD n=1 Tax=Alkalicoccus urumqiensis TaxID=1548213 RepID=A0A2P6MJE0_ALKUR|nr:thiol reductant ABC exporter subunit CydD [Alkalicoccus urumqiensis]PRO66380.1 thiol reductant ABC exporter subunit CydD [Alkalicoccus urumqiensis]